MLDNAIIAATDAEIAMRRLLDIFETQEWKTVGLSDEDRVQYFTYAYRGLMDATIMHKTFLRLREKLPVPGVVIYD